MFGWGRFIEAATWESCDGRQRSLQKDFHTKKIIVNSKGCISKPYKDAVNLQWACEIKPEKYCICGRKTKVIYEAKYWKIGFNYGVPQNFRLPQRSSRRFRD